jgi:lipopolysaccharide biosynthesis glycosyltransferase
LSHPKHAVVFALDQNFLIPGTVAIFSLLKNHPDKSFRIYIMSGDEDPVWIEPLIKLVREMGSEIVLISVSEELVSDLKINLHFSQAIFYRLFAADLIAEQRVVYLDSDLIVHGNLDELWNIDLGDCPLAAVPDPMFQDFDRIGLTSHEGYFNSGVLVMNLDQWRKMDLGKKVRDFIQENVDSISFPDQCGLNAILKGHWFRLSPKWNIQTGFMDKKPKAFSELYFSTEVLEESIKNPKVIHFTGAFKPWNMGGDHPFKFLFWKYLRQTPYSKTLPLDFSILNLFKSIFPIALKRHYWRYLNRKQGLRQLSRMA